MDQVATEGIEDYTGRYSSWEKFITKCAARDMYTPIKNVIKVNTSDSIRTVLSAMFSYKVKSFPVYDVDSDRYRAFVDVFDIVSYVLNVLEKAKDKHNIKVPKDPHQTVISRELAELDIPVGDAMNFGQENFMFMLPEGTLLRELIYCMGPGSKHRLWLYNEAKNTGAGLLTQAKLIQSLQEDLVHFPDIAKKTIEALGIANSTDILAVSTSTKVIDAFRLLTSKQVKALAILDDNGNLDNEFSANDIKALSLFGDFFENLEMSISDYFAQRAKYCSRVKNPPVCRRNDSLQHVMHLLTSHRAHHLFVVEDDAADSPLAGLPGLPLGLGLGPDLGLGSQNQVQGVNGHVIGNPLLGGTEQYNARKPLCVITAGDVIKSLWQFCDQDDFEGENEAMASKE